MLHIPALAAPTGALVLLDSVPAQTGDRAAMMPRRTHIRAENTLRAIAVLAQWKHRDRGLDDGA